MGSYLNVPSHKDRDLNMLKLLRKICPHEVFKAFDEYYAKYYPLSKLNYDQFNEIYCNTINDTKKAFDKLKDGTDDKAKVNMYEAFVAMTCFSDGHFDLKLIGLFKSFDIDDGGTIDRNELQTFLFSAIKGLCKLLDLTVPGDDRILKYTYQVFKEIDDDGSGKIEFSEFAHWIKNSRPLQEFLLSYTGMQTIESAKRRYNE